MEDFWFVGHSSVSAKESNVRCRIEWRGNAENRRRLFKQEKEQNSFKKHEEQLVVSWM